jgi:hypothetical protein
MINSIWEEYRRACITKSDINEHIEILFDLANECSHITEFWVREPTSTYAFLMTRKPVVSYDIIQNDKINELQEFCSNNNIDWDFVMWDTREVVIEPTDCLFIDTLHNASMVEAELDRHHMKVSKYLAFHDVITFGEVWETEEKGIMYGIIAFMKQHPEWREHKLYSHNNWLYILKRVSDDNLYS